MGRENEGASGLAHPSAMNLMKNPILNLDSIAEGQDFFFAATLMGREDRGDRGGSHPLIGASDSEFDWERSAFFF